ncbi:uncharacterized protein LOC143245063 isoform X2 [Tachypleus tridentatus]|uniref:uncharacterized protein LOC143245063 isoform X2 n=1 Tax=Tachypleus tridentatus TaxID=6853 RepID=UPI003FD16842
METRKMISPHLLSLFPLTVSLIVLVSSEQNDIDDKEKSCLFDGVWFQHGSQIPRPDVCENCYCLFSNIFCWQKRCPDVQLRPGCKAIHIEGICCAVYECPQTTESGRQEVTTKSQQGASTTIQPTIHSSVITETTTMATSTTTTCDRDGQKYPQGALIPSATGKCIECRCGVHGQIECKFRSCRGGVFVADDDVREKNAKNAENKLIKIVSKF